MKKRVLAGLLSLAMIFTMLPITAFAINDFTAESNLTKECTCTELCTEENTNQDCTVCGNEGYNACAYTAPEAPPAMEEPESTEWVELTPTEEMPPAGETSGSNGMIADENLPDELADDGVYEVGTAEELTDAFESIASQAQDEATIVLTADIQNDSGVMGVEGKKITFQSKEGERHSLYVTSLAGDCIFDTVDFSKKNNLSANGHYLELTENFTSEIKNIYGVKTSSNDGLTVDSVNMVLKGGSSAQITGTGSNISTNGDVNITIDGHETKDLRGGASAGYNDAPHIGGNININVYSGAVTERFYGGMWSREDFPRNCVVEGSINVQIGEEGSKEQSAIINTEYDFAVGGRYGVINGNINFTVEDGAYITGEPVYAAGFGCEIKGKVTTTINGGSISGTALYAAGTGAWNNGGKEGATVEIGTNYKDNSSKNENVVSLFINGGRLNTVCAYSHMFNQNWQDPTDAWYGQIYGNINIVHTGGTVVNYVMGYQYCKTWGDCSLTIDGGSISYATAVKGDEFGRTLEQNDGYVLGDTTVILDGVGTPGSGATDADFWGIGKIQAVNNVVLKNNAHVNGTTACLLDGIGNLTLETGSAIAMRGGTNADNTVLEDCTFNGNNRIFMCRGFSNSTEAAPAQLSINGKVTGNATLYTLEADSSWSSGDGNKIAVSMPKEGEVYMRSNDRDETTASGERATQLVLSETIAVSEPYVEYTTDKTATGDGYNHAWRIKGEATEVAEQLWYYEVYYQFYQEDGSYEWVLFEDGQGGWTLPSTTVSISHEDFDGKELGWKDVTGTAQEKLGVHYVFDDSNPNNRLSATCAEATKGNPLKIYYRAAIHQVKYEYAGNVPDGADEVLPAAVSAPYYSPVEIAKSPTLPGYTFSGWTVKSPTYASDLIENGIITTMPNEDVVLVGTWQEVKPVGTITITPVDMVAYTGGDSKDHDNFPTTRYKIEAEDGIDLSKATFTVDGKVQTLPDNTKTGDIVVLDWLNDTFSLEQIGSMGLSARNAGEASNDAVAGDYKIEIAAEGITAAVDGEPVDLKWETGTLTVRNVSDPNGVINESVDIAQPVLNDANKVNTEDGIGVAVIPDNTTYYTNGNAELGVLGGSGSTGPQISLLFDDLLPGASGEDTTQLLIDRAKQDGYAFTKENSQFKYLDLINENDGNAWVSTNDGSTITIYWPCPDGININDYNFKVLHFKNLHREYRDDLEDQITNAKIEKIAVTVEDDNLVFTLPGKQNGGSFSPFALIWEAKDDGNNSGGGTTYYTLHYDSNGGTQYDNERYRRNTVVELDKTPLREGYTFTGWYADEELTERITEIKMTSNKTVYAGWEATDIPDWLNGDDHFAYIVGRNDGLVHPEADITRAEAATMFFRLLDDEVRQKNLAETNSFTDTPKDAWYNTTVSTMAKLGIVTGDPDGSFRPDDSITRAEFAAIAVRFDDSAYDGEELFTDIAGHWAQNEINAAANKGWISGYADGTFRPQKDITRAEAVTLVNRVLNRLPENTDDLLDTMKVWPDNQPEDWYYLAVQEATNSHDFERKGDGVHERWTELTKNPDWMQYQ